MFAVDKRNNNDGMGEMGTKTQQSATNDTLLASPRSRQGTAVMYSTSRSKPICRGDGIITVPHLSLPITIILADSRVWLVLDARKGGQGKAPRRPMVMVIALSPSTIKG